MRIKELNIGTEYMVAGDRGKVTDIANGRVRVSFLGNKSYVGKRLAWFRPQDVQPVAARREGKV